MLEWFRQSATSDQAIFVMLLVAFVYILWQVATWAI
jgi:hypothetical protein